MRKFKDYMANLRVLSGAGEEDMANEFIVSGIIDKFCIQFELGWKVLKELLRYEGRREAATGSPRGILKAAYSVYDFLDEETWLSMLEARNDMARIYDGNAARELVGRILDEYIPEFQRMQAGLQERYGDMLERPEEEPG